MIYTSVSFGGRKHTLTHDTSIVSYFRPIDSVSFQDIASDLSEVGMLWWSTLESHDQLDAPQDTS